MQKGQTGILILAGIVLVITLVGGTYYLGTLKNSKPQPQNPVVPSSTQSTSAPTAVITTQDIDLIKKAVAKKDKDFASSLGEKPPEGEYFIKVYEQSYQYGGNYAIGSYGQVGVAGGGIWIAAKVNGEWKIATQGNGFPNCDEIAPYNLPKDLIEGCVDKTGNFITR